MLAYYNELDPFAAAWLRELIKAGRIAPGVVDERSIEDVLPQDLRGFTQVHLFAGIGVWSYALRQAGWPDDRPVWTGSCPCQPFSTAGKAAGFNDERHLWPAMHWLVHQCKPPVIIGEQVASKDAEPWIDLVQANLEAMDYAFGCIPFPSAGVGAPHIRDRAYWVAYSNDTRPQGRGEHGHSADQRTIRPGGLVGGLADTLPARRAKRWPESRSGPIARGGSFGGLGNSDSKPVKRGAGTISSPERRGHSAGCTNGPDDNRHSDAGEVSGLAKSNSNGREAGSEAAETLGHRDTTESDGGNSRPGPTNGFWRDADWLGCRDDKFRPVEPGTFPLVDGATARVGRLRGYGNAINAEAARVWIETIIESDPTS